MRRVVDGFRLVLTSISHAALMQRPDSFRSILKSLSKHSQLGVHALQKK